MLKCKKEWIIVGRRVVSNKSSQDVRPYNHNMSCGDFLGVFARYHFWQGSDDPLILSPVHSRKLS